VKAVESKTQLLHIIRALHSPRGFSSRLHGRQQQANHHTNYSDNNKQFDEGKTSPSTCVKNHIHHKLLKHCE
jgi:hypothetical protein